MSDFPSRGSERIILEDEFITRDGAYGILLDAGILLSGMKNAILQDLQNPHRNCFIDMNSNNIKQQMYISITSLPSCPLLP